MKNFAIIKEAAVKFWRNPILAVPSLISIACNYAVMAVCILLIALVLGVSAMSIIEGSADTSTIISNLFWIIIIALLWLILVFIVSAFFDGILINMIGMKKIRFSFEGKKYFSRIFLYRVILSAVMLLAFIILIIILFLASRVAESMMWLAIVLAILFVLFAVAVSVFIILFLLSPYYIVINNLKVIEAIKKSFKVVWKNFWKFFGLLILLFIIVMVVSIVLDFIPIVGIVIAAILIDTYSKICFYLFAATAR